MFLARFLSALALGVLLSTSAATAATITLIGDNVRYEYDTVINADALTLFGTPTIQGDTVRFVPPSFRAESINGGIAETGAEFVFDRIYTADGREIETLQYLEFGDYEIAGEGAVDVDLLLSVVNNSNFDETFDDEQFFGATGDSGGLTTWELTSTLMPALALGDPAHDICVAISNWLTAESSAAGTAFVQKKLMLLTATPTAVPLPAAAWLFFSGLGVFGVAARRFSG